MEKKREPWKYTLFCAGLWFALGVLWAVKNYRTAGILSTYTLVVSLPGLAFGLIFLRRALKERRESRKQDETDTEQ